METMRVCTQPEEEMNPNNSIEKWNQKPNERQMKYKEEMKKKNANWITSRMSRWRKKS